MTYDPDFAADDTGRATARRWAAFHLGDPSFADEILEAYDDPDATDAELDRLGAPQLDDDEDSPTPGPTRRKKP